MAAFRKNNRRLVFVILGLVVASLGCVALAIGLSGASALRAWLELLPFVAAACILVTAATLSILKRVRPAPADEDGRDPLRVNPSTGLRMRGAVDSGGWTYGSGRDEH